MPASGLRTVHGPPQSSTNTRQLKVYSSNRAKTRGALREMIDSKLSCVSWHSCPVQARSHAFLSLLTEELSGVKTARMRWTLEDYIKSVVLQLGYKLVGWPDDLTFTNLSELQGGRRTLENLEALWSSSLLAFVSITVAEREAAAADPANLAPAQKCVHRKVVLPGSRSDINRTRYRYKTNPYNLPLRHPRDGPKTPKEVPDDVSDIEDADDLLTNGAVNLVAGRGGRYSTEAV